MKEEKPNLLAEYLKVKTGTILALIASNVLMLAVFVLYRLDMEPFGYAFFLNLLMITVFFCISFAKFKRKHDERRRILKNFINGSFELPEAETLTDSDYREMISVLIMRYNEVSNRLDSGMTDMNDYYTVWVHQIKTPISVMSMLLQDDTPEHRALRDELFKIEQYVDMVLNYLRLGSESKDLLFKEYDTDEIIKSCIRKYASLFINRKLGITYEPVSYTAVTDEKWFAFIIEQIFSNAVKYTLSGGVTVVSEKGRISISDTGMGIAAEDLPRIFEKGYTGFNGRSGKKSSGLGLYLCGLAAKKLSIKLSVESTPGMGTTFHIDYPTDKLVVE